MYDVYYKENQVACIWKHSVLSILIFANLKLFFKFFF